MSLSVVLLAVTCCLLALQCHHATGYQISMEKVEVYKEGAVKEYFDWHLCRIGRYNRTSRLLVLNLNYTVLKDIPDDTWMDLIAYELLATNAYSKIPVRIISMTFCEFLTSERYFYPDLLQHSSLPATCPFAKGDYFVENYVLNEDIMPPALPGDRWRIDWTFKVNKKQDIIFGFSIFVYIDRQVDKQAGTKLLPA